MITGNIITNLCTKLKYVRLQNESFRTNNNKKINNNGHSHCGPVPDVVHPLSGTRWTLKHYIVALLMDLNADLNHYFSVRHSVARLELSASTSEVIRHAGAI